VALTALALVGMTSCGPPARQAAPDAAGTSAPNPPPSATAQPALPPRPADLPLTSVQPCALLTPTQVQQLKVVGKGLAGSNNDGQGSPDCIWDNALGPPDNGWVVRFDLKHDASYYLGSSTGAQTVQVDGFPAVQSSSPMDDPKTHCILLVDVAPGQTMYVLYSNDQGDYPGINHQVACQLADKVAEMAVGNLRRLHG
jgi:hypothetical protein